MKSFGNTLKHKRIEKGLTLLEVVALSGISESQLVRLEADAVKKPRFDTLETLTSCLGICFKETLEYFGYSVE